MNNLSISVDPVTRDKNQLTSHFLRLFKALPVDDQQTLLNRMSKIAMFLPEDCAEKNPISSLTTREREVLTLVANGYSRKEIGKTLCISLNTAACHIRNIYTKLEISTVAEATRVALNTGLVK